MPVPPRFRGHLRLEGVSKRFGATLAVDQVDLEVAPGEFFTLVGPSGCGKTTLLRLIAGFEPLDRGRVVFDGRDAGGLAVHERDVGMVFQNYALFPHLDVFENVAFGLRARRVQPDMIAQRVGEAHWSSPIGKKAPSLHNPGGSPPSARAISASS